MEYKDHNQCMTEQQKYAGKFLERQRLAKLEAKTSKKVDKAVKADASGASDAEEEKKTKVAKDSEELSEKEIIRLRKFLEDGTEFKGFEETAVAVLKKEDSK